MLAYCVDVYAYCVDAFSGVAALDLGVCGLGLGHFFSCGKLTALSKGKLLMGTYHHKSKHHRQNVSYYPKYLLVSGVDSNIHSESYLLNNQMRYLHVWSQLAPSSPYANCLLSDSNMLFPILGAQDRLIQPNLWFPPPCVILGVESPLLFLQK